jgi:hypothetical protein
MTVGPVTDGIILSSRRRLLRELRAGDAPGRTALYAGPGAGSFAPAHRGRPRQCLPGLAKLGDGVWESVMASADDTGQRFERDLHDCGQQRLVSLAFALRPAQAAVPSRVCWPCGRRLLHFLLFRQALLTGWA